MKRPDHDEIKSLRACFAKWQTPQHMRSVLDETRDRHGPPVFTLSGLGFIRDAWIAAEFGEARSVEKLRLINDNWPDFELIIDGRLESFEAVEAHDPNRRRGDEYKAACGEAKNDPIEEWIARAEQAPVWLHTACERKLAKHYDRPINLVIYLNLMEYDIRQKEVEACFRPATEGAKDAFETVWILWKKKAYRAWP